jgi:hypothetical protein
MQRRTARLLALTVLFMSAGRLAAQQPARPAAPLDPPAAIVRLSERTELLGNELGSMWTFENAPLESWKKQYGFTATKEWLDHVRLSSVRFGESCSSSFVSPNGLVLTNHHCARECVEANSKAGVDYVVNGFYAATRAEEKLCPGLFLDQLVGIENVTARVQGAAKPGATASQVAEAQEVVTAQIKDECEKPGQLACEVVSLYHGGQYQLYKYKRFSPVKLVFAPELQAGFFGGDPDNFTYPRYDLDISFVRAYEPDSTTAAKTEHYFKWRPEGAQENELVFVTGNPGSTSRQITFSEVMYEKLYRHPFLIQLLTGQRALLQMISALGPQAEQQVRQQLFEIENSLKSFEGQFAGLEDSSLLARKLRWEREFRTKVNADAKLKGQYGDVWDKLNDIQMQKMQVSPRLNVSNPEFIGSPHVAFAAQMIEYLTEMAKPEAQRGEQYKGEKAKEVEQFLTNQVPVNPQIAERLLTLQVAMMSRWLQPTDPLVKDLVRAGETPQQAAQRLATTSKVLDATFRAGVLKGGLPALDTVSDPIVKLARAMAPVYRELTEKWPQVQAAERVQEERLAKALFAVYGTRLPPDATFTLRITDGVVKGYNAGGKAIPYSTNFAGMFERSAQFNNKPPFDLPAKFAANKAALNLNTPFNFVSTTDITGGNSGSPVIDKEARVVGVAFDGNLESLPNEFLYRDVAARTVSVHSAGILEALRNIYKAEALLKELTETR